MIHKFKVQTSGKAEMVEITRQVQGLVMENGMESGVCHIFVPHTTCGLAINENADPDVKSDIIAKLNESVSEDFPYRHAEGNSPAHIKSILVGPSLTVFVEEGAFTLAQARRVLEAGLDHGLRPKLHADQLSASGGAELAAEVGAVSADHLDHVSEQGIAALAAAGVTAVLLPGAVFFLGLPDYAPARRLLEAGVRVAISTDFNPGTCYTENVFLMGTIASTHLKMTAAEVLLALTVNAASALGLEGDVGSLEVGKRADILILNATSHLSIPYHWGVNPVATVVKNGVVVIETDDAARRG